MILYRSWQTYIDARFSNKNTQSDSLPFDADFSGDYMDDIATQSAQFRSHQFKAPFMGHFPINMVSGLPVQLLKKQCHRPCEFASHHPFFCSVNPHTSSTLYGVFSNSCVEKHQQSTNLRVALQFLETHGAGFRFALGLKPWNTLDPRRCWKSLSQTFGKAWASCCRGSGHSEKSKHSIIICNTRLSNI